MKNKIKIAFIISISIVILNISTIVFAENTITKEGTVVTVALKVRESNNFDSNVIGTIAMGQKVSVIEDDNEWGKISYKGIDGYILNEYIDFNIA